MPNPKTVYRTVYGHLQYGTVYGVVLLGLLGWSSEIWKTKSDLFYERSHLESTF